MRKISVKLAVSLIAILVLVGCTFTFSSSVVVSVSGLGSDSDDAERDPVYIFAFLNKGDRDAAWEEIQSEATSGSFNDFLYGYFPQGCYQQKNAEYVTNDNALFQQGASTGTTFNIRWGTAFPETGEDYDREWVYFIAASESNGVCYGGTKDYMMTSGGSNNTTVIVSEL